MNVVKNTELEFSESDETVLDYWLGGHGETKEQWALRVWEKCKEYKETKGKGYDERGMCEVYSRDPKDIWEEKKIRRRIALIKKINFKHPNNDELNFLDKIKENVKEKKKIKWSKSHNATAIKKLKISKRYETAKARFERKEKENKESFQAKQKEILDNVEKLRSSGFSDDTIKIIYPKSTHLIAIQHD